MSQLSHDLQNRANDVKLVSEYISRNMRRAVYDACEDFRKLYLDFLYLDCEKRLNHSDKSTLTLLRKNIDNYISSMPKNVDGQFNEMASMVDKASSLLHKVDKSTDADHDVLTRLCCQYLDDAYDKYPQMGY
jgi:hypothetical protein